MDVILDSVAAPILVSGPGGEVLLMNAPAERLFVVPPGGDAAAEKRVRANDAQFASFVDHLLCAPEALRFRGELNLVDPGTGGPVPLEAMAGKVHTEAGELSTVVTILHDRTEALEKARLYEQLVRASDELEAKVQHATAELAAQNELLRRQALALEQASAAKSQFLANMSHEFRTPLNAILGYTQMLLQGVNGELSPPQRKNLTRIDSNGRHLLDVINDILDITRIEAGRMPLHVAGFAVAELVDEVLAELGAMIQRSGLDVAREVPDGLPLLESDRQKVKQILVNLLSNALKFTHKGQIRVRADCAGDFTLSVTDTGIGIAEAEQQRVFEDFHQVDSSTTRAYGGTGLGLAICRRLAEILQGHLSLRSKPGEGSTFTLHLPSRPRP
jgi:signal transduction histidine kinase